MEDGFMYLYAIIDGYSRYIVAWGLYNTLDASNAIEALERTVAQYGIRISMDGRARCLDNVWIERFWRTIKREYVYLRTRNPQCVPCVTASESTSTITTTAAATRALGIRSQARCMPRPKIQKRILGSTGNNDYLSTLDESSICRALPREGSASHTELT